MKGFISVTVGTFGQLLNINNIARIKPLPRGCTIYLNEKDRDGATLHLTVVESFDIISQRIEDAQL